MTGSYVLILQLPKQQIINIGSLANVCFPGGYYAYVGSARGGIRPRLSHHLDRNKKLHWHIDYLLQKATITDIIVSEAEGRVECIIVQALSAQFDSIPGFGCSDCRCLSHLFFAPEKRQMKSTIMSTLKSLAMSPKLMGLRGNQK